MVIDTVALLEAANGFDEVIAKAQSLYNDVDALSKEIDTALKTPGGNQLTDALDNCVLAQIERQIITIKQLKEELKSARTEYFRVFEEYQKVTRMMGRSK